MSAGGIILMLLSLFPYQGGGNCPHEGLGCTLGPCLSCPPAVPQLAQKYDPQKEAELRTWIKSVTGKQIGPDFQRGLKDGVILCE